MFEDVHELAENKLLLLYIIKKINLPVSNTLVTQIILENNLLNYFQLQQYLSELVTSDFVNLNKEDKKQLYTISDKGTNVLEYFGTRISDTKKAVIDKYFILHRELIKKEVEISADYIITKDNQYIVSCKVIENGMSVIELKLNVVSNEQAKQICSNWKSSASEIYSSIIYRLTS